MEYKSILIKSLFTFYQEDAKQLFRYDIVLQYVGVAMPFMVKILACEVWRSLRQEDAS